MDLKKGLKLRLENEECDSRGDRSKNSDSTCDSKGLPILILDEATSSLDSKSEMEVQKD